MPDHSTATHGPPMSGAWAASPSTGAQPASTTMAVIHNNSRRQPPCTLRIAHEIPNAAATVASPTTQSGSALGQGASISPWATSFPIIEFTRVMIPKTPNPAVNKIDNEAITAAGASSDVSDDGG